MNIIAQHFELFIESLQSIEIKHGHYSISESYVDKIIRENRQIG